MATALIALAVPTVVVAGPLYWTSQQQIGGATGPGPAAGGHGCTSALAWKGPTDQNIYYSGYDEPGQHVVPGAVTNDAPDIDCAVTDRAIVIGWRSAADGAIYVMERRYGQPNSWTVPVRVSGPAGSKPSIAVDEPCMNCPSFRRMVVAWRGPGSDGTIYLNSSEGGLWRTPRSLGPWASTNEAPRITFGGSRGLAGVWKGATNNQIYYSTGSVDQPWDEPRPIGGGGGTSAAPSIDNNFVVWRGISPDQGLYYTQLNDAPTWNWDPQKRLCGAGGSSSAPDVNHVDRLEFPTGGWTGHRVVWKGVNDDPRMWESIGRSPKQAGDCTP
ncbi:hypothetical protein ACFVWG_20250 [Kribbella sp. NPDC058245]|uniref:hypothetical protein n=1 Tax=Kribbella sp. NPDC058245 TaxID=3346399 RepID=UPI0036ECEC75